MPESDIFESRLRVCAHDAREARDLLTTYGIAFVRHGRTAALAGGERLFRFADFGALRMADFDRDFLQGSGNDGKRGNELRVMIALDDLGSDGRRFEAEAAA